MPDSIVDQISAILEENGTVTEKTRNRLLLMAVREILEKVEQIDSLDASSKAQDKRIEVLERKSIILWAEKHPKAAAVILVCSLIAINLWFVSDFRKFLLVIVGLPPDLIP